MISVLNIVRIGEKLHTYVDPKIDRFPGALFFMFSYILGRPFYVLKINWSGFRRFSILLHL